jgi:hypothetical protein
MLKLLADLVLALRVPRTWEPWHVETPISVDGVELSGWLMRRRENGRIVYRPATEAEAQAALEAWTIR